MVTENHKSPHPPGPLLSLSLSYPLPQGHQLKHVFQTTQLSEQEAAAIVKVCGGWIAVTLSMKLMIACGLSSLRCLALLMSL